jgi:hypothetical protein
MGFLKDKILDGGESVVQLESLLGCFSGRGLGISSCPPAALVRSRNMQSAKHFSFLQLDGNDRRHS